MANDDFSPKQIQTLKTIVTDLLDQRFAEERAYNDQKRMEDRQYLTQLFREELAKLRDDLTRLDTRENNDAKESVEQWETFDQRLTDLEAAFKKFTAAT